LEIINADYGTCYTIDNYQLCPDKKLIKKGRMFGTDVIDAFGFFPDSTLKYDKETMIIFAGRVFFDKSDLNIDWQTVQLLSYGKSYSEFTDGKTLFHLSYGKAYTYGQNYDKNTYTHRVEKKPVKKQPKGWKKLTEHFYVNIPKKRFYFGYYNGTPILEKFDVPNLRTIVSKSGFETDYITDGKQVIFGGGKTGATLTEKNGKKYVLAKEWIIEGGVDFASLRVLGKDMLVDKNALYYRENVIPFNKLNGFKFIIREL
jgi:hypothetical protein